LAERSLSVAIPRGKIDYSLTEVEEGDQNKSIVLPRNGRFICLVRVAGGKTGKRRRFRLRNGPSGAVIRVASKQAAQSLGGGDSCGTYVVVNQDIPNYRLCKIAQAIVGK
jgi:hypothetical protein